MLVYHQSAKVIADRHHYTIDFVRSNPTQQNGKISKIAIESTCRVVEILADAGRLAPFKPNTGYYASADAEGTQDFESKSRNRRILETCQHKDKGGRIVESGKKSVLPLTGEKMIAKENRILGCGVTLFHDENSKTALELAALRILDKDVLKKSVAHSSRSSGRAKRKSPPRT